MVDLIGIQIAGLTSAPSLSGTTEFPIQRQGIDKAEKTNLQNLGSYLINSSYFSNYVDTSVNNKIQTHSTSLDPHGDRSYTNTVLQSHTTATDPHGDRAYTNSRVASDITVHINANDPHGDRSFATTSITTHISAIDPHGDRAYSDGKDVVTLASAKTYTDTEVATKVTNAIGTSIAPIVSGKVPNSFLNRQVSFTTFSTFPVSGSTDVLYIDNTNNDIYRWSGTAYVNLTPEVNIGNLALTTDNVSEGTNIDRKYLTASLKNTYDNKLSSIENKETLQPYNNIYDSTVGTVAKLKNIVAESDITLVSTLNNSIGITDNVYKYKGNTVINEEVILTFNTETKEDILKNMLNTHVYNINGEVSCLAFEEANGIKYIIDDEKILINTYVGMKGILEEVSKPTSVVINSAGNVITGNSVINKQVKAYNSSFVEVGIANVLSDTTFTISLSTVITDGSPIYLYTIDGTARSKSVKIYSPNLGTVKQISLLSVDNTGLLVKGMSERNSTITIYKDTTIEIGTGISDINGFFSITLTEPVVENQILSIKTINSYTINRTDSYTVKLSTIDAPFEVLITNERTNISGKAEPNSTITLLNNVTVIDTITVDSSGNFTKVVTIPTNLSSIILFIELNTDEYTTTYIFNTYVNETNKPKENLKVTSSEFGIISSDKHNIFSKNNYEVLFEELNNNINIKVKNIDSKSTKWLANFKINKIEL